MKLCEILAIKIVVTNVLIHYQSPVVRVLVSFR